MNSLQLENGESVDLDTDEGCYQYVGDFLNRHAASSGVWAALAKLYRDSYEKKIKRGEG